jgi:integrase
MCEVMAYCGTRYEEVAALRRTPAHVDMRDRAINIFDVMAKDGTIRPYPKSKSGERTLPVDDDLWPRFRDHVMTVQPGELIFTAPGGGPLLYDNWRKRVWYKGLLAVRPMTDAEIEAWKEDRRAAGLRPWKAKWVVEAPVLLDPQPTAHDLRHLYGTRLVEAGVPKHERRYLMGHKDDRAGIRYENAREHMQNARDAMARFRHRRAS